MRMKLGHVNQETSEQGGWQMWTRGWEGEGQVYADQGDCVRERLSVYRPEVGEKGHKRGGRGTWKLPGLDSCWRINYSETFLAAVKMPLVCVILVNAAEQDWEMHQINVKSTYLQAPLKETIYMRPLHGVLKPGQEGKVCHLLKGL